MKKQLFNLLLFASFLIMLACKKETPTPSDPQKAEVLLDFNHVFGQSMLPFSANTWLVHPRTLDSLNFQVYKYYLSNIKLQRTDETWYTVPESYHLICATCNALNQKQILLNNVPSGSYKAVSIMFGVDSTRNVSGAQTGALDPALGMFWSWNSGYIMIKAEGSSPQAAQNAFTFHLGGFQGENNIVLNRTFTFTEPFTLENSSKRTIKFNVNTARLWHSFNGVATTNTVHMPGLAAKTMATEFYNGFNFIGIE